MNTFDENKLENDFLNKSIDSILKLEQEIATIKDAGLKASSLLKLGITESFRKNYDKAIKNIEDAQKIFLETKDTVNIAVCLAELALVHYKKSTDRLIRSLTLLNDAKYLLESIDIKNEAEAKIIHYHGIIYNSEKRFSEALKHFMKAQRIVSPNCLEYAKILDSLALFYLRINNQQVALKCLNNSIKIKNNIGNKCETAITELILGRFLSNIENYEDAATHLVNALAIYEEIGDYITATRILDELAKVYIQLDKYDLAENYCRKSLYIAKKLNLQQAFAFSACTFANIKTIKGHQPEAIEILETDAEPVFVNLSSQRGEALVKRTKALAFNELGQNNQAIENLHESLELFKESGITAEVARCYFELSKVYKKNLDIPMALSSLLEALRIAKANNLPILTKKIEDLLYELDEDEWSSVINKTALNEEIFTEGSSIFDTLALYGNMSGQSDKATEPLLSLLRIGRAIAAEPDLDKLLVTIAEETRKALGADRCTVFLLDKTTNELWSKVALGMGSQEIRFPSNMGLAGHVLQSGEAINIKDTYDDPRFNKEIDKKTGYKTKTLLCMPMRNLNHEIIGVFQVLNKLDDTHFTDDDEDLLIAIGSSAGIALENANLLKKQVALYEEQKKSFSSFINTLAASIDARDKITAGHSKRVTLYAVAIAQQMGMTNDEVEIIEHAAILHDIGKIGIKDSVLCKEGKLTTEEYKHIQEHAKITDDILKMMYFEERLKDVPAIASSHHEKYNGSGYFRGLKSEEIPLGGRIIAVSDVFDAITSKRHYRERMDFLQVLDILKNDSWSHFDGNVVNELFKINLDKILDILITRNDEPLTEEERKFYQEYSINDLYLIFKKDAAHRTIEETKVLSNFDKHYQNTSI